MTERTILEKLMAFNYAYCGYELSKGESKVLMQALTELQKYREIGTKEEFQRLKLKIPKVPEGKAHILIPANLLPEGWVWEICNYNSGALYHTNNPDYRHFLFECESDTIQYMTWLKVEI